MNDFEPQIREVISDKALAADLVEMMQIVRRSTIEECAEVAATMRVKHGSPVGDAYSNGVWDQGVHIEQAIRAMANSPAVRTTGET